jgi:hypothetical protein
VPARVTVYAGSSREAPARYLELAHELGRALAQRGWVLVYGGANIGLMGACADGALAAGGRVEGVILDSFARVAHSRLHALDVVGDMRARKAGLARRGDAFVALPGGFGTLEEVSEILVERQLAFHTKPLVLLDPDGFWIPLLEQFERMASAGLLRGEYLPICQTAPDVESALQLLEKPLPFGPLPKW